jgi:RND family efflux transporter MFP subunit
MLRPEVRLGPGDRDGSYVIKDPTTDSYYQFGSEEHFLLIHFDGIHSPNEICAAYEKRFNEPLAPEDLDVFVAMVKDWGLVQAPVPIELLAQTQSHPTTSPITSNTKPSAVFVDTVQNGTNDPAPAIRATTPRSSGTILAWHFRLIDPNTLFNKVVPHIKFVWTRAFVFLALCLILTAGAVAISNRAEFALAFPRAITWQLLAAAWISLILAAFLHEFAHGLTCKRYGGDVHEVGFLFLYFTPCFYCDVSDAWMMSTSKRIIIMLAGSVSDLLLWALALIVWRITVPGFFLHDLAWMTASVCGVRVFLNANPLIKLDGYYLLSDLLRFPNLRDHSWNAAAAFTRKILWGAPSPDQPRAKWLLFFGLASWMYSTMLVALMLYALLRFSIYRWGPAGIPPVALLALCLIPSLFAGLFAGEVIRMLSTRHIRTLCWTIGLLSVGAIATFVRMDETASGPFTLRATRHVELRSPVTGYLREVYAEEGQHLPQDATVARLDVPDLAPKLAKVQAQIAASEAQLKALDAATKKNLSDSPALMAEKFAREEEITAHIKSLQAELAFLQEQSRRQTLTSPIHGQVLTARVNEKIGQYFRDGELICEMQDPSSLEVEIALPEESVLHVQPGQLVYLKVRAARSGDIPARVTRIAPKAHRTDTQSTVTIYCTLDQPSPELRSGMTGHAKIQCGSDRIATVLARRTRHFLRTEFWW